MVGKYDIVHVQLFACIVKDNDPGPLVENLMSLLSKYLKALLRISDCVFRLTKAGQNPAVIYNGTMSISRQIS